MLPKREPVLREAMFARFDALVKKGTHIEDVGVQDVGDIFVKNGSNYSAAKLYLYRHMYKKSRKLNK